MLMIGMMLMAGSLLFADPAIPAPVLDPQAEAALASIEKAATSHSAFSASVAYESKDNLLGEGSLRTGSLVYEKSTCKPMKLAVLFQFRMELVGDSEDAFEYFDQEAYIIDGSRFIERDDDEKLIITRTLDGPADMQLGGRFPLPIGQKQDDVNARFIVSMLDAPQTDSSSKAHSRKPVGLRLVPKPGTPEAEDWSSFELWYDTSNWLPFDVKAIKANGDERRIRLTDLKTYKSLPEKHLAVFSLDPPGDGWVVKDGTTQ